MPEVTLALTLSFSLQRRAKIDSGGRIVEHRLALLAAPRNGLLQNMPGLEIQRSSTPKARIVAASTADRTRARPEQVTEAFRSTIKTMQSALRSRPDDCIGYAVNELEVGLKSLLALEKHGMVRFVLPEPADHFDPGQLTAVRFRLRTTPAAVAELTLFAVPPLPGLSREAARAPESAANFSANSCARSG